MEIVHSVFEVAHQTVDVSYSGVGGRVLRDEHQGLPVVIQSLSIFSVERGHREEENEGRQLLGTIKVLIKRKSSLSLIIHRLPSET